jgi:hypothetical protein
MADRYNPQFSYAPPSRENVASTGITIALLNPVFISKNINYAGSPWTEFAKAMGNDIEDLLTAKGFKVRGPFNSMDEMVVPDKMNSDFVVQVTIDMNVLDDRKFKTGMNLLGSGLSYKVSSGNVTINPAIRMTFLSCFSAEKLSKKDLDIPQTNFQYSGTQKWDGTNLPFVREFNQDVNLWNPFCKSLEEIYKESFDIMYKQFDKDEMAEISKVSKETDKNRRN